MPESERDELLQRVAAELRRPVPLRSDFDARVMAAVRDLPSGRLRRLVVWLCTPQTISASPLLGLAAAGAAAVVLAVALPSSRSRSPQTTPAVAEAARAPTDSAAQAVQFVLVAPAANRVSLVGDFNDWDPAATPLATSPAGGVWTVMVPLSPGQHSYAFVVDGSSWVADPQAPPETGDDFGRPSSLVTVTRARRR